MPHPLENKIHALRARVRRLVVLHGICWVVAAVLATVMVLGSADYLIRFQDRGIRVICSLLVLGALGWTCYRFVHLPLIFRLRDVDLAARVQRRFPDLDDRLVSSVEFLQQSEDEPLAGSAALRRAVIVETTAETERLDFSEALDSSATRRAGIIALSTFLVAATLAAADPPASSIAVARLANPFNDDLTWPRENLLRPRQPVPRVARGGTFRLEVIDEKGNLPAEARIHYQSQGPDGTVIEETRLMTRVEDVMEAVRENVVRPFYYRLEGGDYRAKTWTFVDVVDPPQVRSESLSIRLVPPDYTGWPRKEQQGDAARQIRALVGTRMEITARVTRPIQSAVLCLEADDEIRRVPAEVSDDGLHFAIPGADAPELLIEASEHSGSYPYWFELTDREDENIVGGHVTRGEIHAVVDTPPTVVMERPTEKLFVVPRAAIPLQVTVKDDLATRKVALVFGPSDGPGEKPPAEGRIEEPLDPGPNLVQPQPGGWFAGDTEPRDRRRFEHLWELAKWDFTPGAQLSFHVEAIDSRHQVGECPVLRLIVITEDELQARIAARQDRILAELTEVLKTQREARKQVRSIGTRLAEWGHLEGRDLDRLQAAALNQSQVDRRLTAPDEGVPKQVVALLSALEINKVDSPDIVRRMQNLQSEIDRLRREHLPVIGRELTAAIKAARLHVEQRQAQPPDTNDAASSPADPTLASSLTEAGKHQDRVVTALEEIRRRLAEWDHYRRFHRRILQLTQEQKKTARRTVELGNDTVGKPLQDLSPQQRADLRILAGAQLEYARRLEQILQEMDQAVPELQQSNPLAADTVADALDEARRLAISSHMQSCGDELANNRVYQASALQEQIVKDLQQVLTGRRQQELARLADAVKELRQEQQTVIDRTRDLAQGQLDRTKAATLHEVARQQRTLQSETTALGERLLGAPALKLALAGAARHMSQAAGQLERLRTDPAMVQAENALRRLDLLLEALKSDRPPADASGAGDAAGGSADRQDGPAGTPGGVQTVTELKVLALLQQEINLRTEALDAQVSAAETITDPQRQEYALLSEEQGRLADLMFQLLQGDLQAPEDDPDRLPDPRQDRQEEPPLLPIEEGLP